ncbi:hypothetical protein N0V90_006854 [Kalmusia sp. IMI 367209]|nr:hypothetical protein N0V90_006854 [Kalmusia sp. IMI 367209]
MLLLSFLAAVLLSIFTAATPTEALGSNGYCGFANRGDLKNSSQYTYFRQSQCRVLGDAAPVKNLYREFGDVDCKKTTWYLSADYGVLPDEVADVSRYYKCITVDDGKDELRKD